MIYALCGPLAASVGRFAAREYRDSHKGIKRRDGPLNGLNGGLLFLGYAPPCWTRTQNSRLEAIGGHTSGGELPGSIGTWADTLEATEGTKNPPQESPGRALLVFKIFSPSPR